MCSLIIDSAREVDAARTFDVVDPRRVAVTGISCAHLALRPDLTDLARATFGYVDALHFAGRACAPALFSVAGQDCVCPPSTVFAAYNHYAGPKDLRVWPFNAHEGGGGVQAALRIDFLRENLDQVRS